MTFFTTLVARITQASALGVLGKIDDARSLIQAVVKEVDATEYLAMQGDARRTAAEVFDRAGDRNGARHAIEEAIARYELKGDLLSRALAVQTLELMSASSS